MNEEALAICQEKLARVNKDFEEFVYLISHDMKAPIRAISNLTSWIEEDLGEAMQEDVKRNMNLLRDRTSRLEKMLQAILQLSRVSRFDLEIKTVPLQNLLQEASAPFQKERVVIRYPAQLPAIHTYYKKLQTVLEELFRNAVIHSDKEIVEIEVQIHSTDSHIEFTIQDNGPGIADEIKDKIFKMFYSGKEKEGSESIGAGLPLVKQILGFVGGSIGFNSNADGGVAFLINWPIRH